MRQVAEELRMDISAFVEQREALALVLWTKGAYDTVYAFKLLDAMEQASGRDIFLLFSHDCFDPSEYVEQMMVSCDLDIDTGNLAIREGLGDADATPWESLPRACFDAKQRPIERVRGLVEHIRRYYPDPKHRIVLAFLPAELSNPNAYAAFADELLPYGGYEPWMAGLRLIFRDSQKAPTFIRRVVEEDTFGVQIRPIDFSTDAMTRALVDSANDTSAPPAERMMSFIQIAGIDQAWGRHEEAIAKYRVGEAFYTREQNHALRALCILHQGYCHELRQRNDSARERFQRALELGLLHDIRQVMLNAFMALGGLHQREQDWRAAATYWEGAAAVARAVDNVFVIADACHNAGICHVALGDSDKAREFWEAGKQVGQQAQYWERVVEILRDAIEMERRLGLHAERQTHEQELRVAEHEQALAQRDVEQARAKASESAAGGRS